MLQTTESTVLTRASKEWYRRPNDERFLSLEDLHAATLARAEASEAVNFDRCEARVFVPDEWKGEPLGAPLRVETPSAFGPRGEVTKLDLTPWTLGQLSSMAKVPAKMVKDFVANVPSGSELAAANLNAGLKFLAPAESGTQFYVRTDAGEGQLMAITGNRYGRIYDHRVVEAIQRVNADGRWKVPGASYKATNPLRATTLYASDHDVFIFLVDESRSIEVKTPHGTRNLFRGFFAWNSEVGAASFGLTTFLYDFVCDNRMVWGATEVQELRIRHTSGAPDRFEHEGRKALAEYSEASAAKTEARLRQAARFRVGKDKDEVLEFLRKTGGYTPKQGERILERAREEEGGDRTLWQVVNGATALARSIPQTDRRLAAERKAARMLRVAA